MKILRLIVSLAIFVPVSAFSQAWPGHAATNSDLLQASDLAQSTLSSSLNSASLTVNVVSASSFVPNSIITIDLEQIKVCSIAGLAITVCSGGRGYGGTTAIGHNAGAKVSNYVSAAYHNLLRTEIQSIEGWLNSLNGPVVGNGTTAPAGQDPLGAVHGGSGATTLSGILYGNSTSPFTAIPLGSPLSYLRAKPNVASPVAEFSTPRTIEVPDYNFTAITPGGALSAATLATVTIPYAPLGVSGSDTSHYLRITGGTGAAEAVLITGGTCFSGTIGNCTIRFTPANSHSGAWTIVSATAGIQEALNVSFNTTGYQVHAPAGAYDTYAPIAGNVVGQRAQTFRGDGPGYYNQAYGTIIVNHGVGTPGFSLVGDLVNNGCEAAFTLSSFTLHGSPTSGTGISASNACMLRIDHVFQIESQQYGLSCGPNCYTLAVTDSEFYSNGLSGISISDAANEVHFDRIAVQGNCRQSAGIACHGLVVSQGAALAALAVTVENSGFALDGVLPLVGFPSSGAEAAFFGVKALTFSGNYCEQPLTHCLKFDSAVSGFGVANNYMQQGGISMDAGAASGTITGNRLISGSQSLSITNVTNSGGFCRVTVSAAPTIPFTVGAFESLAGIGGATACNDTSFDTAAVIQSVQSTTQFTTGRVFSGAYTSGGTAIKASGYSVGGSSGYSDIHVAGNSINTSVGGVLTLGGDLLPGPGADIASSVSISPNYQSHIISGTAAIDTMTPPSGFAGQFCALPTGAWTTTTAGNFAATFTATPGLQKCWTYKPSPTSKWY